MSAPQKIPAIKVLLKNREALEDAKIPIVSSEGREYFDADTVLYNYKENKLLPADKIISDCEKEFLLSNLCVIMIHPQDFAGNGVLNEEKYKVYLNLLDWLPKIGVSFTRFKDLR